MIRINSFLHRERLYHVIRRWMLDDLQPGDADEILHLVHFNNVFVSRYLQHFTDTLFAGLHEGVDLRMEKVSTKGALRDVVSRNLPPDCHRCRELAAAYSHRPGRYFRETPFNGKLYFHDDRRIAGYLGSCRIKRIRRLAEKTARRLVDRLHDGIRLRATDANLRQDHALDTLMHAEHHLLEQLREHRVLRLPDNLAINDVAGVKVILEMPELKRLLSLLQHSGCRVIEQERHDGIYRATNLVVEYQPDREQILHAPLHDRMLEVFAAHGFSPRQVDTAFREFVRSGEKRVYLEIIVTSYLEMLESEIGRCMHEARIIRQRHNPRYYGQLAQNVGFLMEFLFTVAAVPGGRLERLPVRIWNRYLPDYFDEVRRRLFDNPSVELNEL